MRIATFWALILFGIAPLRAQTVSTTLTLNPVSGPVNSVELELDASALGSDSDSSDFSGTLDVDIEVVNNGGIYDVTGLTFTGGMVAASDVSFSLFFGTVTANATNLAAVPFTVSAPGAVTSGSYSSIDHGLEINEGTVEGPGFSMDLSTMPITGAGTGMDDGMIDFVPGTPLPGFDVLDIEISFPVDLVQEFVIPGVPIFGDVDANLTATGTVVASGSIQIESNSIGDFDADGMLDCDDIDALGAAIRAGSSDAQFDLDGNGAVDSADYGYWVTNIMGTVIGDANLDGRTDVSDFNIWNANKFTNSTGWCTGDFNGDGQTDVSDFNLWNSNKFTSAAASSAVPAAVPEPTGQILVLLAIAFMSLMVRANVFGA